MAQLFLTLLSILQVAIIIRVLWTWVDPNPYPTNAVKRVLWQLTDPVLEPLRRVIPPLGMFDISPMIALMILQAIQQAIVNSMGY